MTRKRWYFAAGAFGLGLVYTGLLALVGVEVRLAGRDVALPVAAATELAFGIFGFFLGKAAESRASARREAELERESVQRLAAMQSRLLHVEKLATVGQLASRIAHEVRNPLGIIRSTIQNLRETASPAEGEVESTCAQVLDEIDRLNRVTTSLAGLSRPVTSRVSAVEVTELLSRVEWLSRRLLEGRPISFRANRPKEGSRSPSVRADPDLACQVLLGLVANAAEETGEGGTIELDWREAPDEIVFRVSDRGPGIASEIRERIFEPFFTTKPGGTGLGLAVARDFAEAQGGRLAVEDVASPGATFGLHLPRVKET